LSLTEKRVQYLEREKEEFKKIIEGGYIPFRMSGATKEEAIELLMIQKDSMLEAMDYFEPTVERVFGFNSMFMTPIPNSQRFQNQTRLFDACRKDPELKEHMEREFEESESFFKFSALNTSTWKQIWMGKEVQQAQIHDELNKKAFSKMISGDLQLLFDKEEEKYSLVVQHKAMDERQKALAQQWDKLEEKFCKERLNAFLKEAEVIFEEIIAIREKAKEMFEVDKPLEDWQLGKAIAIREIFRPFRTNKSPKITLKETDQ